MNLKTTPVMHLIYKYSRPSMVSLFSSRKFFLSVEHNHVPMEFNSNQPFIVSIIVITFIISKIFLKLKGRNNHWLYAKKDSGGYHCNSPIYFTSRGLYKFWQPQSCITMLSSNSWHLSQCLQVENFVYQHNLWCVYHVIFRSGIRIGNLSRSRRTSPHNVHIFSILSPQDLMSFIKHSNLQVNCVNIQNGVHVKECTKLLANEKTPKGENPTMTSPVHEY